MNSNLMGAAAEEALLGRGDNASQGMLSNNDLELNSMRTANANMPGGVG